MTSKIYIAAAEELGEKLAELVRAGRKVGMPESIISEHVNKSLAPIAEAMPADVFETIKTLALDYAEREASKPASGLDVWTR